MNRPQKWVDTEAVPKQMRTTRDGETGVLRGAMVSKETLYARNWRNDPKTRERYLAAQRRYVLKKRTVAKKCNVESCQELASKGAGWTYCKNHQLKKQNPKMYARIRALLHKQTGLGMSDLKRELYLLLFLIHSGMEEINENRYNGHYR